MDLENEPEDTDDPAVGKTLKGYPVGPPRTKQRMPTWVWVFLTFFVCGMAVVMLGVMSVSVEPRCPTEGVTVLILDAELGVDSNDSMLKLTLQHRGGDPVDLRDYRIIVNGVLLDGTPVFINELGDIQDDHGPEMSVGEQAYWVQEAGDTAFAVGEEYTVRVIEIDSAYIVWEGDVLATGEDI